MSLLEYFFPKFPPLAKDPIPNIKMIKTTRHVTITNIKKIEDIYFSSFGLNYALSDFKDPV